MRKLFVIVSTVVSLAAFPALAQGTSQQKAACEKDSHKFCASAEPDAIAVEKCLKKHMGALSKGCQRQFKGASLKRSSTLPPTGGAEIVKIDYRVYDRDDYGRGRGRWGYGADCRELRRACLYKEELGEVGRGNCQRYRSLCR